MCKAANRGFISCVNNGKLVKYWCSECLEDNGVQIIPLPIYRPPIYEDLSRQEITSWERHGDYSG